MEITSTKKRIHNDNDDDVRVVAGRWGWKCSTNWKLVR